MSMPGTMIGKMTVNKIITFTLASKTLIKLK